MKKRILSLLLVFAMLLPMLHMAVFAAEEDTTETPYSVTVYFSVTDDGAFVDGMGMKKITVPYFDLEEYGLEQFYFSSERYTSIPGWEDYTPPVSDLEPGTKEYAKNQITMLHLFIYALEMYRLGYSAEQAGHGRLFHDGWLDTDMLSISGSTGSMFMVNYWGMDYNLNYYKNYEYPLASAGWGATADQILLHDGDVITLGHFSGYSFYNEPNSIFGYIQPTNLGGSSAAGELTVANGTTVDLTLYHAGPDNSGNYTTAHTAFGAGIPVYYCVANSVPSGVVGSTSGWTRIGDTDANGEVHINTSVLGIGTFFLAMPGQFGVNDVESISCTPGGIRLVVQ